MGLEGWTHGTFDSEQANPMGDPSSELPIAFSGFGLEWDRGVWKLRPLWDAAVPLVSGLLTPFARPQTVSLVCAIWTASLRRSKIFEGGGVLRL